MSAPKAYLIALVVALECSASGCVYHQNQADTFERAGTPLGFTGPFEKLMAPVPPPGGFSSSYQKMLLDRQRQARKQAEQQAQAKSATTSPAEKIDSIAPSTAPPA